MGMGGNIGRAKKKGGILDERGVLYICEKF